MLHICFQTVFQFHLYSLHFSFQQSTAQCTCNRPMILTMTDHHCQQWLKKKRPSSPCDLRSRSISSPSAAVIAAYQAEVKSTQGPGVKAKKAPSAPSMDEWDGLLAAGHTEYRGRCPFFCVAGKGKSEAHRRMEASRDDGHPEPHLDYANKGREMEDRASPILVCMFSKDRWLITHPVPCTGTQHRWIVGKLVNDVIMSGVQTLVEKSDQEVSIADVKNSLIRELRGVEGLTVMLEESLVGASAANAVIGRSVWEMQSATRAIVAYAEWVHGTVFEPGSAVLTLAVEFSGQVVSRLQRSVSDEKAERRKQRSNRKALVPFGELVKFMLEKPKDKGENRNRVGIMLGLVDRSDEVVIGTTERVVKARTVHRVPAGSEAMPRVRRASEADRGTRIQRR